MDRKYIHVDKLSEALDSGNLEKVLSFLSHDCLFVAGNAEPVKGEESIKQVFEAFFPAVKSTNHQVEDIFETEDSLVHRGKVTYTRLDDTKLTVPFCDVFKMEGDLIQGVFYLHRLVGTI